jgi:DNA-binding MarR family transcriptional regulator
LDSAQQRQWRSLARGTALLLEALGRDLEAGTGLSLSEYEVLVRLSETPDRSMRMSSLADQLVHSRSRLTHTVRRMEDQGLVSRCSTEGDRRGVNCTLTDAGYERLVAAAPVHVASVRRRLVDVISAEQMAVLGEAFEVIGDEITADPSR